MSTTEKRVDRLLLTPEEAAERLSIGRTLVYELMQRGAIVPLLRDVPLRALMEATGLSKSQCSMIKRRLRIPHERHWNALRELIG